MTLYLIRSFPVHNKTMTDDVEYEDKRTTAGKPFALVEYVDFDFVELQIQANRLVAPFSILILF